MPEERSEYDGESTGVTYRCTWCEETFVADPEKVEGCPYCLRRNILAEEEIYECDGCGFVGPTRVADYYGADIQVCRSCGQRNKEAENDDE